MTPLRPIVAALAELIPPSGAAEDEPPERSLRAFYPAPSFVAVLDPSVLLVLGERGTGKTELFRVLRQGGLAAVLGAGRQRPLADPRTEALTIGPEDWGRQAEVSAYFRDATPEGRAGFWLGLLARRIAAHGPALAPPAGGPLGDVLAPRDVGGWAAAASRHLGVLFAWLDDVDRALDGAGSSLVVCYDQLDLTTLTYGELFGPLRALLQLWYEQRRRWRRLRPKLFLRPDLFTSEALAFPDGSKFFRAAARELAWDRRDLYEMWVKRLANGARGDEIGAWVRATSPTLRLLDLGRLGQHPVAPGEEALVPLVHALVGAYMGANARKGASYPWVPNHVRDAHGRVAPRAFLTVWAEGAGRALERGGAPPIAPEDLQHGVERASLARLVELAEDDPWIRGLAGAWGGAGVPTEADDLAERLRDAVWPAPPPVDPARDPRTLLAHLAGRGVVEVRVDGRLSVPDLYLHGLGMRRKGGVRRAR